MDIQQIGNLTGYPVYVFGADWVEKHTASCCKVRHLFTKTLEDSEHAPICGMPVKIANVRCSCLGWMRFGDCKHLKMLRDDWSWIKDGGVVLEYVRAYLPDLDELLPGVAERFERQFAMDAELLGAAERRQQNSHEDRDDRHDNEQFDKGKAFKPLTTSKSP